MKDKTITLKEYNRIINKYNSSRINGLIPIIKRNKFKIALGCGLILSSFILPLDFGLFAVIGLSIMGFNKQHLEEVKRRIKNKWRGWA